MVVRIHSTDPEVAEVDYEFQLFRANVNRVLADFPPSATAETARGRRGVALRAAHPRRVPQSFIHVQFMRDVPSGRYCTRIRSSLSTLTCKRSPRAPAKTSGRVAGLVSLTGVG